MKNLFKSIVLVLTTGISIASCNNNDFDFDQYMKELEHARYLDSIRIDSTFNAQKSILADYAALHLVNAEYDTYTGIWYEYTPSEVNPENPVYKYTRSTSDLVYPTVEVKYKGKLVTNDIVFEDKPDGIKGLNLKGTILAWQYAFFPKKITWNTEEHILNGLTTKGLQKGDKIKIAIPSTLAYDLMASEKIPANSPLYFEIEVVDIK